MLGARLTFILALLSVASPMSLIETTLLKNANNTSNDASPLLSSVGKEFANDTLGLLSSTFPKPFVREEDNEDEDEEEPIALRRMTLVKCQCQGNEIRQDGNCKPYSSGTLIGFNICISSCEISVADLKVIVRNVSCDPGKTFHRQFTRGQFHLRVRGDIVVDKVGDFEGQRINNYCVKHHLNVTGHLTWTMNACIPLPSVPRCCPPGQAMKKGSCQSANTPAFLDPPINAKPFSSQSVKWPNISNFLSHLNCKSDLVHRYPLSSNQSNLVSLADGVALAWLPEGKRDFIKNPDYCVDGIERPGGTVDYFTSFCYTDPKVLHERICAGGPCIRKCCPKHQSVSDFKCVKDVDSTFDTITCTNISNYKIVTGWPICNCVTTLLEAFQLDGIGNMKYKDKVLPPTDYCVDTLKEAHQKFACYCLSHESGWTEVRKVVFPTCIAISLIFLIMTIICHVLVPRIRADGGETYLFYSVALTVASIANFTINVFKLEGGNCVAFAVCMQLGYLTAFFWLNVMCFEIWMKVRMYKLFRQSKDYPAWCLMLYAWGVPVIICSVTVAMQFSNDTRIVKPGIGVSRCWFEDDMAKLVYFYGPVALLLTCNTLFLVLAYHYYRQILQNYMNVRNDLTEIATSPNSESSDIACSTLTSSVPRRPLTNLVHDFTQKILLFVLMATCWVTEILSWQIQPIEIWSLTDTLNCLQGLFVFIVLLFHKMKRKQIEEKFPQPFKIAQKILSIPSKIKKLWESDGVSIDPVHTIPTPSNSTVSSSTLETTSCSPSSACARVPSQMASSSVSLDGHVNDVFTISHSSVYL